MNCGFSIFPTISDDSEPATSSESMPTDIPMKPEVSTPLPEPPRAETTTLDTEAEEDDDGQSSSDDSYLSYFDDSDDDDHEEETQAARNQREQARNEVLQAAGLSVRRPPPGVPGPRKPRRRAPPQPPASHGPEIPASTPPMPAAKPRTHISGSVASGPDAYDRYEAYLAKAADATSRARSQSDARPTSVVPSSPGFGLAAPASPSSSSFAGPSSVGKEGMLAGFVSRISAGASQSTGERRATPAISGPVNVVRVDDSQGSGDASGPTTWSSLVDAELLKNISPQERKHQEVRQARMFYMSSRRSR